MDSWIIRQLRAFVLSDIREFVDPIEFEQGPDNLKVGANVPNHQYFTQELQWAHFAYSTGKRLFFNPTLDMTARQISSSDVLMNMGLLVSAQAMHAMLTQLCKDASKASKPIGNSEDIRNQLEHEHIPVFLENMRGALTQYFLYLSEDEKAPFISLIARKELANHTEAKASTAPPIDITTHCFDVALSFPGEVRTLVEKVVADLHQRLGPDSYFYDNNYVSQLARPNLDVLLQDIYRRRSKIVVVFLSEDYEKKNWCGIEFRAIREIIFDREDRIMFIQTSNGKIPGVFKIDGYVDANRFSPEEIAKFIQERVLLAKIPVG